MTTENKLIIAIIAVSTLLIATLSTVAVYFIFGQSAGYFFMIVLSVPIGAISSLLLMILYKAVQDK